MWSVSLQEDMNLNEERKAPLREKDLSTKREMVVQYISATAKSVSSFLSRTGETNNFIFFVLDLPSKGGEAAKNLYLHNAAASTTVSATFVFCFLSSVKTKCCSVNHKKL